MLHAPRTLGWRGEPASRRTCTESRATRVPIHSEASQPIFNLDSTLPSFPFQCRPPRASTEQSTIPSRPLLGSLHHPIPSHSNPGNARRSFAADSALPQPCYINIVDHCRHENDAASFCLLSVGSRRNSAKSARHYCNCLTLDSQSTPKKEGYLLGSGKIRRYSPISTAATQGDTKTNKVVGNIQRMARNKQTP